MKQEIINEDWQIAIKQIANNSVDLVVTDPPYGMEFQSNFRKTKHKSIQNDDNLDWLGDWVKELSVYVKMKHTFIFFVLGIT